MMPYLVVEVTASGDTQPDDNRLIASGSLVCPPAPHECLKDPLLTLGDKVISQVRILGGGAS